MFEDEESDVSVPTWISDPSYVPRWNTDLLGIAAQSEALDLSVQARTVVVENLCGPFNVAAGSFERLRDGFAFDVFHREVRRDHATKLSGMRVVKMFRQRLGRQLVFHREKHGVLDDALKLAHIPRPLVTHQQRKRG